MSDFWTAEKEDKAIALWEAGLDATRIARELGAKSRNAILGKLHRLKLKGHKFKRIEVKNDPAQRKLIAKQGVKARAKLVTKARAPMNNLVAVNAARRTEGAAAKAPPPPAPTVIDASHAKPWLERRFGECAYPIAGEGAETVSCCAPTKGRTYCPGHHARMFRQPDDTGNRFVNGVARFAA